MVGELINIAIESDTELARNLYRDETIEWQYKSFPWIWKGVSATL